MKNYLQNCLYLLKFKRRYETIILNFYSFVSYLFYKISFWLQTASSWYVDTKGTNVSDEDDDIIQTRKVAQNLVIDDGELKQKMKEQWDQQERENMQKEFIHYQNVLFDGKLKLFSRSSTKIKSITEIVP